MIRFKSFLLALLILALIASSGSARGWKINPLVDSVQIDYVRIDQSGMEHHYSHMIRPRGFYAFVFFDLSDYYDFVERCSHQEYLQ